jgi:hypothetical protein
MLQLVHLYLIVGLTLAAYAYTRYRRDQDRSALKKLAVELGMNYVVNDQFKLAERIVEHFPVPGAARLVVTDLIYALQDDHYRYVFTASYTIGAVKLRRRAWRVAVYEEPAPGTDRKRKIENAQRVGLAPTDVPWTEQYRALAALPGRSTERPTVRA